MNDREHCRRRADPEGERDNGGRRKARGAARRDERCPKIAKENFHQPLATPADAYQSML